MKVNNVKQNPSFGMALKKPNIKHMTAKEIYALDLAMPELKEIAKNVDIVIKRFPKDEYNTFDFFRVHVSKINKSLFEKIGYKLEEFAEEFHGKYSTSRSVLKRSPEGSPKIFVPFKKHKRNIFRP